MTTSIIRTGIKKGSKAAFWCAPAEITPWFWDNNCFTKRIGNVEHGLPNSFQVFPQLNECLIPEYILLELIMTNLIKGRPILEGYNA